MVTILLVAALQTAAPPIDAAKYRGVLVAGAKIEAGWRNGVSLIEFQEGVKGLSAELLLAPADNPRLSKLLEQTESLLIAGAVIWRAKIFEAQRSAAADAAELVGTRLVNWDNEFKFRAAIDDGVAMIRAFRQVVNGDGPGGFKFADETLAGVRSRVDSESPETIARRNKAAADAARAALVPLSPEELEAYKVRLQTADNSFLLVGVANELAKRGPAGMRPLAPILMVKLKAAHESYVVLAIYDALKNMRGEARDILPELKEFVAGAKSLYGADVVAAIEKAK